MSKKDITLHQGKSLPDLSRAALDSLPDLPAHREAEFLDIFRSSTEIMRRDTEHVVQHGAYLDARINQLRKAGTLVDERINIAAKIAEMQNVLIDVQRQKEHERWQAESQRNAQKVQMAYENRTAVERLEAELAKAQEARIRAQRNRDAAERTAPAQIDEWYAQQEARRHNAYAERQDAADLARTPASESPTAASAATAQQRELDLATLEHEIELQRKRGNHEAVLALQNLRARLKVA